MEKVQVCTLNAYVGIEPIRRRGIYKKAVIVGLSLEASTAERLDVAQARQGWQQGRGGGRAKEPRHTDTKTHKHKDTKQALKRRQTITQDFKHRYNDTRHNTHKHTYRVFFSGS